ncbi:MAG: hypothetical protein ACTTID_03610 [Bacillales bacterium]
MKNTKFILGLCFLLLTSCSENNEKIELKNNQLLIDNKIIREYKILNTEINKKDVVLYNIHDFVDFTTLRKISLNTFSPNQLRYIFVSENKNLTKEEVQKNYDLNDIKYEFNKPHSSRIIFSANYELFSNNHVSRKWTVIDSYKNEEYSLPQKLCTKLDNNLYYYFDSYCKFDINYKIHHQNNDFNDRFALCFVSHKYRVIEIETKDYIDNKLINTSKYKTYILEDIAIELLSKHNYDIMDRIK